MYLPKTYLEPKSKEASNLEKLKQTQSYHCADLFAFHNKKCAFRIELSWAYKSEIFFGTFSKGFNIFKFPYGEKPNILINKRKG